MIPKTSQGIADIASSTRTVASTFHASRHHTRCSDHRLCMPHLSCPEGDSQKTVTPSAMSQAMTDSVEKGHSVWKEFQRRRNGILVNLEYVVKCELTSIANELEEENAGLLQRNFDSLHRNKVIVSTQKDSISKSLKLSGLRHRQSTPSLKRSTLASTIQPQGEKAGYNRQRLPTLTKQKLA